MHLLLFWVRLIVLMKATLIIACLVFHPYKKCDRTSTHAKRNLIGNSLHIPILTAYKCILWVIMILSLMKLIAIRGCFLPSQGRRQLRSPSRATSVKQLPFKWDANRKLVNLASWHYQPALGGNYMQIVCKWPDLGPLPEPTAPSSHGICGLQVG